MMRAGQSFFCWLALLLGIHLAPAATKPAPTSNEEGQKLAAELRLMRPTEDLEVKGFLKIRDSSGKRTKVPINYRFISAVCNLLGIRTRITWSMDYPLVEGKTERLVHLCRQAGASEYISGPSARDYIDASLFARENIALRFFDYTQYPEYHQLFPPFTHQVSIVDLLLNEGPQARRYMKSF